MNFPKLKSDELALLRAEVNTGHILDESFELYNVNSKSQIVYTVFTSKKEAKTAALEILTKRNDIEVVIYDSKQNIIFCDNSLTKK